MVKKTKQSQFKPVHKSVEEIIPYQAGKPIEELVREKGLERIVKLASNENPLGPSPAARDAVARMLDDLGRYPDGGGFYLKKVLSESLNVAEEMIVLGNGSNEILELLAQLLLADSDETVYAWPAFIVYRLATLAHGARGIEVPLDGDLKHDLPAMAGSITERTKLVFISNPNNPTGTFVKTGELVNFLDGLPQGVLPVLDEAYYEYARDVPDFPDGVSLLKEGRNLVVMRTFSKAYGLAGLRVGYALMPRQLAQLINRVRQPFNVNSVAQAAAVAAVSDGDFLEKTLDLNRTEMKRLEARIGSLGFNTVPSAANFLLIDLAGLPGGEIFETLLDRGVIVRAMDAYGLPGYIRVTVGLPEENDFFLEALTEIQKEK
ncbi:MAG: histidinol-phosphate transaminase [bacterium]